MLRRMLPGLIPAKCRIGERVGLGSCRIHGWPSTPGSEWLTTRDAGIEDLNAPLWHSRHVGKGSAPVLKISRSCSLLCKPPRLVQGLQLDPASAAKPHSLKPPFSLPLPSFSIVLVADDGICRASTELCRVCIGVRRSSPKIVLGGFIVPAATMTSPQRRQRGASSRDQETFTALISSKRSGTLPSMSLK